MIANNTLYCQAYRDLKVGLVMTVARVIHRHSRARMIVIVLHLGITVHIDYGYITWGWVNYHQF